MESSSLKRATAAVIAAVAVLSGCGRPADPPAPHPYQTYLYMTDTYSGKVYAYDPEGREALPSSIAATGQNGTGEIAFNGGEGYACVGMGSGAGLYRFDPSDANPSFTKIGASITAQYVAFPGSTKGYVSTFGAGLYSFDPSSFGPSLAPVAGTSGMTVQEVVIGSDGFVYAADNGNGAVIRIDPSDDSVKATIQTSADGTTGLVAGMLNGNAGVFVANTGGYDPETWDALPGSIDFIAAGAMTATAVADELSGSGPIYPARLVQLSDGDLLATGYGHTYRVDLSGAVPSVVELTASGSSFGSMDIACKDGLVYIPASATSDYISYSNFLYVLGEDGEQEPYSPVAVMGSSESVTNIGFYED
jgi:hypothetical protein